MTENTLKVLWHDWKRRKHDGGYDQTYAELYLKDDFGGRLRRCVERMNLKKGDSVLDIGCGNGLLSKFIPDGVYYFGYDKSEEMIADAERNNARKNVKFSNCGFFGAPFDKICLFDLVEHLGNEELKAMLTGTAFRSFFGKNGKLYIHTPNADYFMEKLKKWGILPQLPGHIAVRNGLELAALLTRAGFHVTKIEYLPHYTPLLRWTHWLSDIPKIGKYFKARIWIEAYC